MKASTRILTINAGSSSIKFSLFESGTPLLRCLHGSLQWLRFPHVVLEVQGSTPADNITHTLTAADRTAVVALLLDWIAKRHELAPISAVGHRIVHGGPDYFEPQLVSVALCAELAQLSRLDPEHLPQELQLLQAMQERFPELRQIVCFDTAFHHDLPRVAQQLAIPRHYEKLGVRRYGFHGLSYAWLLEELTRLDGKTAADGRLVLAHLGNGASLAAVHKGKCVDTTMGFTPAGGIMMGTRSGDLDPGLMTWLMTSQQMNATQFSRMINFGAGLLGISETSSDMRELLTSEPHDPRAAEAIALFCYQIRKCIGAYAAAMGGVDTLVFTGGIGENAPEIRARICKGLEFLGIDINVVRNDANVSVLSAAGSSVRVRRIHTDEEQMIARAVSRVVNLPVETAAPPAS